MPFDFKPYDPPPRTNLRERLIQQQAKRLRDLESRSTVLQAERTSRLSPVEAKLNLQYLELLRAANVRLRDGLEAIKRQNAAERKAESDLKKLTPLQRTALARGFFRSSKERVAAIEGILERERRQSAPLTREAEARAKAIAASRRFYNPDSSQLRGGRGYDYSVKASDLADPCAQYVIRQHVRREVMFAQRSAGRGYRKPHMKGPC